MTAKLKTSEILLRKEIADSERDIELCRRAYEEVNAQLVILLAIKTQLEDEIKLLDPEVPDEEK